MSDSWSFTSVWNQALDAMPERETEPREHIWASEMGRGYYDRYFKMHGRKPTTPPNLRARRKFEAGNLTEWVIEQILTRAGILRSTQDYIINEQHGMKVTGRLDFIAGGMPHDVDDAFIETLPEKFVEFARVAVARLKEDFPDGMREQILELKSCSSVMFDQYEKHPSPHHSLQAFHYSHNTKIPATIEYVSRDDVRMKAWVILPEQQSLYDAYVYDIQRMREVYDMPEEQVIAEVKQPLLVWDDKTQRFKKNFEVEYSLYLTDYGFEKPDEYAKPAQSMALRASNIVKRIREGKEMSKVNLKTIEEVAKFEPMALEIITAKLNEKVG